VRRGSWPRPPPVVWPAGCRDRRHGVMWDRTDGPACSQALHKTWRMVHARPRSGEAGHVRPDGRRPTRPGPLSRATALLSAESLVDGDGGLALVEVDAVTEHVTGGGGVRDQRGRPGERGRAPTRDGRPSEGRRRPQRTRGEVRWHRRSRRRPCRTPPRTSAGGPPRPRTSWGRPGTGSGPTRTTRPAGWS
jgi:hypothetical protein